MRSIPVRRLLLLLCLILPVALARLPATDAASVFADSIEVVDGPNQVGLYSSLALDANGNPVISYYDNTGDNLKVAHCNDANCAGDDESIETVDSAGDVGQYTSLALDEDGYPVVAYHDATNTALKVLRCNDANCAGGDDSIQTVDAVNATGYYASLVLDADGYPVVSYLYSTATDLRVLHCNDPNCAGGDESIETVDAVGSVGAYSSLALDADGYPVVAYYGATNDELKVLHCNDPNCEGGDESIESVDTGNVGLYVSLVLAANGHPVMSYHDQTNGDLKVARCNDPNCDGGNESIEVVDTVGDVGEDTSLALNANGFPIVSYYDVTNQDLKVLRCNDRFCAGDNESIISVDTEGAVGQETSLVLDESRFPVVSYYHVNDGDLRLLRCDDIRCDPAVPPSPTPTATASDTATATDTPTPTLTATATATDTATATATAAETATPTTTASATPTVTETASPTTTASVTPTTTASVTATSPATSTATATAVETATPTTTASATVTPTSDASLTATPTITATGTPTPSPRAYLPLLVR